MLNEIGHGNVWTKEQDDALVKVLLDCIRDGKSRTRGFTEAAKKLHRTSGACSFRWNNTLKHSYAVEIRKAEMEAFRMKKAMKQVESEPDIKPTIQQTIQREEVKEEKQPTMVGVYNEIKMLFEQVENAKKIEEEYQTIKDERDNLLKENNELKFQLENIKQTLSSMFSLTNQ